MTELLLVVKATVVLVLGLVAATAARRARASVRHAILASTFAALLALPVATVMLPGIAITIPADRAPAQLVEPAVPPVSPPPTTGAVAGVARDPMGPRASLTAWTIVVVVWGLGAALVLVSLTVALINLRRLRRHGLPWMEGRSLVASLATRAGVRQPVEVLVHERVTAPLTCGLVRPAIVIPAQAREWTEVALRRALVHELEHVRRRDWSTHLTARIVCAVYWFHPLVWIAYRQLQLDAERACDDAVVGRDESTQYAEQPVSLARTMAAGSEYPALAMASRSDLSARVSALLDAHQSRGRAGLARLGVIAVAAAGILLALAPTRMVAATTPPSPIGESNEQGRSRVAWMDRTLVEAASEGELDDVRDMLDKGADVNATVSGDGSPLIVAAREGHAELVTLLLDRGADPNLGVLGDGNALIMAAREGHVPIVGLLLDRGAEIDKVVPGDENALIQASGAGALDVVRLLVARGADVNARVFAEQAYERPQGEWRTPLGMAARGGHSAIVAFLKKAGATQ